MANAANTTSNTPLFADEWDGKAVADLARYALRQPGNIASLVGDLQVSSYRKGDTGRIWTVERAEDGAVLAEEPSLYKAIHKIAA